MSDKVKLGFDGKTREVDNNWPADGPPPWGADKKLAVVGKDHPRVDARLKATGGALYSYDRRFPNMIYAGMLRCPHASAVVTRLDLSGAEAMPGVVFSEGSANKRIWYAGDSVAGIAAESEQVLRDALAAIAVEYEVRPHAVTVEDARKDGVSTVGRGPNAVQRPHQSGDPDRVNKMHGQADVVLEREYETQVQTHSCLETHGCVCKFDEDGSLTVWASTQSTFFTKTAIARAAGLKPDKVTVITEHMGGGFGSKFGADDWDRFCVVAARETGRPCRYLLDRREEHLVAGNRPDSIQRCRFSANRDGTLAGAWVESHGTAGVGRGAGVLNPAIYRFGANGSEQKDVRTHAGRARAFRAPRHPQGVFALEGMMDELAEKLGLDPVEFRKRNDPHPVRSVQWDIGRKAIGWRERPRGDGPVKTGYGCAASRWGHNARPGDAVRCRIGKDGSVLFANGSQDIGTGTRTLIAVLGAEELGVPETDTFVIAYHGVSSTSHTPSPTTAIEASPNTTRSPAV